MCCKIAFEDDLLVTPPNAHPGARSPGLDDASLAHVASLEFAFPGRELSPGRCGCVLESLVEMASILAPFVGGIEQARLIRWQ